VKRFLITYRPLLPGEEPQEHHNWVRVSVADSPPYEVEIQVALLDGRLICTAMRLGVWRIDGAVHEITAKSLRDIPLGAVLERVAEDLGTDPVSPMAQILGVTRIFREPPPPPPAKPRRPGSQRYDHAFYEEIARLYREGLVRSPGNPYAHMRERHPGSLPTQRRWVQEARRQGLLGPARPGKPGEYPERGDKRTDSSEAGP